ncbi:serine/threonine protein kinase [Salinarchaeum sp. Harcht-Bsk1]|uniref:protein kinase domain-containing protein n=1 Tax=Salinarchaeum sp. Harcht-Bsk1 TaxID=1333523 RepID=UPI00034246EE|nr:protein kinase [Salinarchaeum sp. Harcht-Bsk1]AGN00240.1 serine/threonine protein kinase [Salinarchaeum sp. Harcht-Bsk1]
MAIENQPGVRALIRRTLDAPADAREAVPALVDALDHDDPVVRAGVAWAICAVATAHPADAPVIVRRLDGRHGHTAAMAANWIRRELDVDAGASTASSPAPPSSSADDSADDPADSADESPSTQLSGRSESGADADDDVDRQRDEESSDDPTDSGDPIRERPDEVVQNGQFTIELARTDLDALEIVEPVESDRHSWTYAGMAGIDAERHAVLVRTYRSPLGARHSTFSGAFEDVLADWDGVDDHENVLTVHDFGRRPHPWIVTGYAPRTLRSVGRLPVQAALRVGLDAAKGLAHAHEKGITHRTLDPRSIALDSEQGRPVGKLANFGIVDAFQAVDGPLPLDSRFAAPELFDSSHGAVDWLTDVYQLGAVLYTAFAGRPPYRESLVSHGGPAGLSYEPPSSVVEDVPVAADRIVAKAMATHKIARYESADEFARDLQSALSEVEDGT